MAESATKSLAVKERAFAEMVADYTDTRTLAEKCKAAGWANGNMAFEIMKRDRVAEMIDRLVEQNMRALRAGRGAVMAAVQRRASKDGREANEAAKIYLQATGDIGTGGVSVNNSVTANASGESDFGNRLRSLEGRKGILSTDQE